MQNTLDVYDGIELTDPKRNYSDREKTGKNSTQSTKIYQLLLDGGLHPVSELLDMGIAQYNARIYDLRKEGHHIQNVMDKDRKTYFQLIKHDK